MTTPSTYKLGYPGQKYSMVPCVTLERDPTSSDLYHPTAGGFYEIPTIWVNKNTDNAYILTGITGGTTANWQGITSDSEGSVIGPDSSTNNALVAFDGTDGKQVRNTATTISTSTGTLTFPQGGGVVLTIGGVGNRKGTSAFTAGVSPTLSTTSVQANSAIVITRTTLSGATAATGHYVTITPGVGFTVTSGDPADTSIFTWAIVG